MSSYLYIKPDFLFGLLDFNIAKILHIDGMVIWLLMGCMGAIYWFLPEEFGIEMVGIWAAEVLFFVFRACCGRRRFHLYPIWRQRCNCAVADQPGEKICRSATLGSGRRRDH